jgi:type VI secretion system protein ImpH
MGERTVEDSLFAEAWGFDFFQAVRLLQRLAPGRPPVGYGGPPAEEAVRFAAHLSLAFPASAIQDLARASGSRPPLLTVTFLGLTGPSGVLPRHYTELLLRVQREVRGPERHALCDWLDLFNHRLVSLFFRAWEKYRFWTTYERQEGGGADPDAFTGCLFSLIGLGTPRLRGRLRVAHLEADEGRERLLAAVEDLALLHYGGLLAQRRRNAAGLGALLHDYFGLPVEVRQFQGQWLYVEPPDRSRLGGVGSNNELGVNVVAGERVWDVQSKIRIRVGPLSYAQFLEYVPDQSAVSQRKAIFLFFHLVRLYVGPELDFDVQLILRAEEVPECQLSEEDGIGPRLGWNTWLCSQQPPRPVEDAVFAGGEVVWVEGSVL